MIIKKGDILIDRKTLKKYPIYDFINGHIYLELDNRLAKRSLGQVIRHRKKFLHLKVGEVVNEDVAFFCPKKNKITIIEKDTLFLGEV